MKHDSITYRLEQFRFHYEYRCTQDNEPLYGVSLNGLRLLPLMVMPESVAADLADRLNTAVTDCRREVYRPKAPKWYRKFFRKRG